MWVHGDLLLRGPLILSSTATMQYEHRETPYHDTDYTSPSVNIEA